MVVGQNGDINIWNMSYFLGIDLGTSYFKAGIFDDTGVLKGLGRQHVEKVSDGVSCELPVDVFCKTLQTCVADALCRAGIPADAVKALSYASQANSFILLNRNTEPLTPLVLWPDERAKGIECPLPAGFMEKSGLGIRPNHQFATAKIRWFQKYQPDIWAQTSHILSISGYFTYILTGQIMSDYSTASMTGMFDRRLPGWWDEYPDLPDIRREQLPALERSGTPVGRLTPGGARLLGLSCETCFVLGGLDHHIAAVGAGIPFNGYLSESTGTVLACVDYVPGYFPQKDICIAPGLTENDCFRMTFGENGALTLEWYQKQYAPEYDIPALLEMAAVTQNGGLTAMPCAHIYPGLSGFRRQKSRPGHGDYVRAIMESTACSLAVLVTRLKGSPSGHHLVSTGGGSRSHLWMQIKQEILQSTFHPPKTAETACLGAAVLGMNSLKK
jgi:sugar (pentulose or hexulose) kinase